MRALDYFNQRAEVEAIIIVRGGGSADDLVAFNDEGLARAIASSRIPIMTGIGHEVDESLADLVADVRASTPSNAAERLVPDRQEILRRVQYGLNRIQSTIKERLEYLSSAVQRRIQEAKKQILLKIEQSEHHVQETMRILQSLNPESVLKRGYAIVTGKVVIGKEIEITTIKQKIRAEVKDVQN